MKKILGIAVAALMVAATMVGCASTKNNGATLGGADGARAAGRPGWAYYGCTFISKEAGGFIDGYVATATGYFAEGEAARADERSSQIAARLDARANLAGFISSELASTAEDNGISTNETRVEVIDQILNGSRIIDSVSQDGKYYILMFISDEDLEKSSNNNPTLKSLIQKITAEHLADLAEATSTSNSN